MNADQLRDLYTGRQMEPASTDEKWVPESNVGLA